MLGMRAGSPRARVLAFAGALPPNMPSADFSAALRSPHDDLKPRIAICSELLSEEGYQRDLPDEGDLFGYRSIALPLGKGKSGWVFLDHLLCAGQNIGHY